MKIILSITRDYCGEWGVREGVREVLQNWLDSDGEREIRHEDQTLVVRNLGVTITPADVGLLGRTSKGPADRGQFGEGLKIGALALVRAGLGLQIRSSDRWYRATLERQPEFDDEVLVFDCGRTEHTNSVTIEIEGLGEGQWREIRQDFLELRDAPYVAHRVPGGEILLEPEEKGRVYCKGIFVRRYDDLDHGYNFCGTTRVDRDRKMVDDFDLNWELSRMHAARLKDETTTASEFLDDLQRGSRATRFAVHHIEPAARQAVVEEFVKRHGRAVPGDAPSGVPSVAVTPQAAEVLKEYRAERLRSATSDIRLLHQWTELEPEEQNRAMDVEWLFEKADIPLSFQVVDFESESTEFARVDGHLRVARQTLGSRMELLSALAAGHELSTEDVYRRIIAGLRGWRS